MQYYKNVHKSQVGHGLRTPVLGSFVGQQARMIAWRGL